MLFLICSAEYSRKVFSVFSVNDILAKGKEHPFLRFGSSYIVHFVRSLSISIDNDLCLCLCQ